MNFNNISKSHQEFANDLNNPRVLTHPEEFLGPNYRAVLDFWLFLDELTEDQWETFESSHRDFYWNHFEEFEETRGEVWNACKETIGGKLSGDAGFSVIGNWASYYVTLELIGMHKLFEQQKPLTFFQENLLECTNSLNSKNP